MAPQQLFVVSGRSCHRFLSHFIVVVFLLHLISGSTWLLSSCSSFLVAPVIAFYVHYRCRLLPSTVMGIDMASEQLFVVSGRSRDPFLLHVIVVVFLFQLT